ncbi:MAG TPA: nodulation protein NfeD [Candidatus Limnocylindrales bacterium]|nr:nodulation protein NfeD [Candidatus Limnocylindrales bacterium]
MPRHIVRLVFGAQLALGIAMLFAGTLSAAGAPRVVVLPATGVVDNVFAGYLSDGVARAAREGAAAVVIRLNTPGGSLEATNDIVGTLLESAVPTIVWVAPAGGRAASAGTFITLAANIAVMAPGTNIGAASPVGGQGEDIPGTLGQKVKNDAIAKMRSIAEERHRNVDWAVSTVDTARSSPASEAVSLHAVDGIAATLDDVISFANGKQVDIRGQARTLDLTGATTSEAAMNPFQSFLHLLSDENIAFLLLSIGSTGLLFEVMSPNFVTGILGALAVILAFIGFGSLPLNVAGLLLIALGIVLFGLETTVTSHGLLAVGGLVSFVLGASALYSVPGDPFAAPGAVAVPVIAVTTITLAAFMVLIVVGAVRSRHLGRNPGMVGAALGIGTRGVVRRPLDPRGSVYAGGEEWTARSVDDRPLERGVPVKVVEVDGLTVVVEPDTQPSTS